MKSKYFFAYIVIAIIILSIAYYLISPAFRTIEADEESRTISANSEIIAQGDLKESAHEVEGKALIINDNGKTKLRFEDFETINGPDLHIYLSSDLDAEDYIDLGKIKATKGNVNYDIPSEIDISKYNKVLVWCVPFRVLFSYAELK